jgi:hypothetical protein
MRLKQRDRSRRNSEVRSEINQVISGRYGSDAMYCVLRNADVGIAAKTAREKNAPLSAPLRS